MAEPTPLTVYFDYRCPFCYRLVRLLTAVEQRRPDVSVCYRHFSLEQLNAPDPRWKVWEQPLEYDLVEDGPFAMRMLRSFLASYAAQRQGPEAFARFRLRMFVAKHDRKKVMSDPKAILTAAQEAGLDMVAFKREWQAAEGRERLREDHTSGEALGVAGLPALVVGDGNPIYVRLAEHPPQAEREAFFSELIHLAIHRPYLRAFRQMHD
jgi:predicted DsbA family dithiol-disulfide isomerase